MTTFTVRQQLTVAFGALAALVLVVSFMGLRNMAQSKDRFSGYTAGPAERETLAVDVRILANRRALGVRDMVLASSQPPRT